MSERIGGIVITRNEGKQIEACLESLSFCDTTKTPKVAHRMQKCLLHDVRGVRLVLEHAVQLKASQQPQVVSKLFQQFA